MKPDTKRCSGHEGHWVCADKYPDHEVPKNLFGSDATNKDGLDGRCRRCKNYYNGINNSKIARAEAYAKSVGIVANQKEWRALPKERRDKVYRILDGETSPILEHSNVVPFPEKEQSKRLPSFVRNTDLPRGIKTESERNADKQRKRTKYVPQGWLYAMRDHLKGEGILKCGKTNDLGKRLSEANTWGDFEILHWVRVSHAVDAETMMHNALFGKNIIREWFRVSIEEAREVMDLCAEEYYWPEEQNNESQ